MNYTALTIDFHHATHALAKTYSDFKALTVYSNNGAVTFYLPLAADVQSIADDFNAVLSPKDKEPTNAE
jgi:hypothetical protein